MSTRQAWQRSITDDAGNLLTGVQISVFQQDGITPATIYSGLTDAAMANPFNTGVQTVARFYAEPGLYVVRAFKEGVGTQEWVNVDISGWSVREDVPAMSKKLNYTRDVAPVHQQMYAAGQPSTANTDGLTGTQLILVPSGYQAVRIMWAHKGSTPLTGLKMVISATDDIGNLSMDPADEGFRKFVTPWIDGAQRNTLTFEGWKSVTWAGQSELNIPATNSENWDVRWSDLIPVNSRPLQDDRGGKYAGAHPLLLRFFLGSANYLKGGYAGINTTQYLNESGASFILGMQRAGDSVTNLLNWVPASQTVVFNDSQVFPIGVVAYKDDAATRSVMVVGDSRFAVSSEFPAKAYRSTQFFIEKQRTDRGEKFRVFSCSQSGATTATYYQRAMLLLETVTNLDALVYLGYSINNGAPTPQIMADCKFRLSQILEKCSSKKIPLIAVSSFPSGSGFTPEQMGLLEDFDQYIISLGLVYLSPLKMYGLSDGTWQPGTNFNNSHMTDDGYQNLAERINSALAPFL